MLLHGQGRLGDPCYDARVMTWLCVTFEIVRRWPAFFTGPHCRSGRLNTTARMHIGGINTQD